MDNTVGAPLGATGMRIKVHPKMDESKTDWELQAQRIEQLQKEYKLTGKITPIKNGESKA